MQIMIFSWFDIYAFGTPSLLQSKALQTSPSLMRLPHTSDWHLGLHFMGKTRLAEHGAFIDWLILQVRDHAVDAVIIAGDIFDTGAPPSYARELYNQLVVELHNTGTSLLMLGGNHDSVATLGESRPLLSYLSTTVIPAVKEDLDSQVLVLNKRNGRPGAIVCAIPFIRPCDVMPSQAGQSAEEKQLSLQEAIHQHYQAVYQLACAILHALQQQNRTPLAGTGNRRHLAGRRHPRHPHPVGWGTFPGEFGIGFVRSSQPQDFG